MKHMLVWIGSGVCAAAVLLAATAARGDQVDTERTPRTLRSGNCTVGDLRGAYGHFRTGIGPQGPVASVGINIYDGHGNGVSTQWTSRNGVFTESRGAPIVAEVNPDCTGRWLTPDRQGLFAHFVIVDEGNEIYFLSTSAGNAVTGVGKRISR